MSNLPSPLPRALPVFKAFSHMLSSFGAHWRAAVKPALPWLALLTLLNIWGLKAEPISKPPTEFNINWIDLVAVVIGFAATSSIAVTWHRFILMDAPMAAEPPFRLDKIVLRYMGRSLVIYGLCLIPLMALVVAFSIALPIFLPFLLALMLQLAVFVCRMSISLPAIAIGNAAVRPKEALESSRGNNLRILGLLLLTYLILAVAFLVYLSAIGAINAVQPAWVIPIAIVIGIPIQFFSVLMNATLLTSLYGFFIQHRDF